MGRVRSGAVGQVTSAMCMEPVSEMLNLDVGSQNIYLEENFSREYKFYRFTLRIQLCYKYIICIHKSICNIYMYIQMLL